MNILAFAGSKQSGKNTASNFLHGYQLRANHVIKNFHILDTGELVVETDAITENGEVKPVQAMINVTREDEDFASWAALNMWPYVKNYSFASSLKDICMGLFGLTFDQCYGTDDQKNTPTKLRWENMPGVLTPTLFSLLNSKFTAKNKLSTESDTYLQDVKAMVSELGLYYHEEGVMTAREVMQFVGTEVFRKMYNKVWIDRTLSQINDEQSQLAVISDCRFPDECESVKEAGGKIIKLLRRPFESDNHASEVEIEKFDKFDAVIDNRNLSIAETCKEIYSVIDGWGWLGEETPLYTSVSNPKVEESDTKGIRKIRNS